MSRESYWKPCFTGEHHILVKWAPSRIDKDGVFVHHECVVCRYGTAKRHFVESLVRAMKAEYSFYWGRGEPEDQFTVKRVLSLYRNSFSRSIFLECYEKAREEFSSPAIASWERNLRSSVSPQKQ